MAASIKISELNSLETLTDVDLFLVSDMESTTSKKITYANLKSNLVDNLATAVSDLTGVVSQNNTTVTASIAALQTIVDNLDIDISPETLNSIDELSAAMGDDPAFLTTLQNRLDVLETDPTTQADVDAVNQSLTISLGEIAGDVSDIRQLTGTDDGTNVLGSFNGGILPSGITIYSALYMLEAALAANQTKVDALDINLAPEALNSIDELAAALGDDPNIIPNLQSQHDDYVAMQDDMNLGLMLAYNDSPVFIDTLFGG
jgi:plasmid maintenance system antidote protein VapI